MRKWYFETSAFNYLLENVSFDALLQTREFQKKKRREFLVSPVTLWEIMLTGDDSRLDFLVLCAQNLFSDKLLATPAEMVLRYLQYAYPDNKINYDIYTNTELGETWSNLAKNDQLTLRYCKDDLRKRTSFIRQVSSNLKSIIDGDESLCGGDNFLHELSNVVKVYYDCLKEDGFIPEVKDKKIDQERLFKTFILFVLIIFVIHFDFYGGLMEDFWNKAGVPQDDPTKKMMYIFETYPLLMKGGPILEVSMMAYNQLQNGTDNRGIVFDALHMIYAPCVDYLVTGDAGINAIKNLTPHYNNKLLHVSEMLLKEVFTGRWSFVGDILTRVKSILTGK